MYMYRIQNEFIRARPTAAFSGYETWREPWLIFWKKLVGCHHRHLLVIVDWEEKNDQGRWEFFATDWYCEACGWHQWAGK